MISFNASKFALAHFFPFTISINVLCGGKREARGIVSQLNVDEFSLKLPNINLAWPVNLDHLVAHHFSPVSDPAGGPGNGDDDADHVRGDVHGCEEDATVVVNIRVNSSRCKVLVRHGLSFDFERDLKQVVELGC